MRPRRYRKRTGDALSTCLVMENGLNVTFPAAPPATVDSSASLNSPEGTETVLQSAGVSTKSVIVTSCCSTAGIIQSSMRGRLGAGWMAYRDPGHASKQATAKIKLGHEGLKQAGTRPQVLSQLGHSPRQIRTLPVPEMEHRVFPESSAPV